MLQFPLLVYRDKTEDCKFSVSRTFSHESFAQKLKWRRVTMKPNFVQNALKFLEPLFACWDLELSRDDCQHNQGIFTKFKCRAIQPCCQGFWVTCGLQGPMLHPAAGLRCNLPWTGEAVWGECSKNANQISTKTRQPVRSKSSGA